MSAPQTPAYRTSLPTDPMCIASLVCALLGLNIIAVILGHIGYSRAKRSGAPGEGFAIAGLIIGYLTLLSIVAVVIVMVVAVGWSVSQP